MKISKIGVIIGGILIIIGLIIFGTFILYFLRILDLSFFSNYTFQITFIFLLFIIGILDLISGILLLIEKI